MKSRNSEKKTICVIALFGNCALSFSYMSFNSKEDIQNKCTQSNDCAQALARS